MAAGNIDKQGYFTIKIDQRRYLVHRLVWLWKFGRWPEHELDHINSNRSDNRIENLRECRHAENQRNMRRHRDNRTGFKGVSRASANRWHASIYVDGNGVSLGLFRTPEEAHAAYVAAAEKNFGAFARRE